MKKYVLIICLTSLFFTGCSINNNTSSIIGNKRYTPTFLTRTGIGADNSGRVYGQFSHHTSERFGIAFDYTSNESLLNTGNDDSITLMEGNHTIYMERSNYPSVFMRIFTGNNIASSIDTIRKFFQLDQYPSCNLSLNNTLFDNQRSGTLNQWGLSGFHEDDKKQWNYYHMWFSGDLEISGTIPDPACPYQKDIATAPILITYKNKPNTILMVFRCEMGCGPAVDFSRIPTLEIFK